MTYTAPVFNLPDRTYTPLDNGFNLELAETVLKNIEAHQYMWNQGNWRGIEFFSSKEFGSDDLFADIKALTTFEQGTFACGTAMCVAGWAGELSKVDWVVDADLIKKAAKQGNANMRIPESRYHLNLNSWADWVLVPIDQSVHAQIWDTLPPAIQRHLARRGFTEKTHKLAPISEWAAKLLGIGDDPANMFRGGNTIEYINECVNFYAKYGANPTRTQLNRFLEQSDRSDNCTCSECMPIDDEDD
jgi:hypothetical protein